MTLFAFQSYLGLAVITAALPAQIPSSLADFRAFTEEDKRTVIRRLERAIQLDPSPAIQRIVSMQRDHSRLPVAPTPPFHQAKDWAEGVAPTRQFIYAGDERHAAVRERFPTRSVLSDLHKGVWYDWGTGKIVRRGEPLNHDEVMENIYNGYPPGSDDALANLLKEFDTDKNARKTASYLSHLYADLQANVFEGVTMYEAWYSGEIIDVPDVDAIPFAIQILKTRSYVSPIPNNPRRTALYAKIRDHAFEFRIYRTLREAAAIAFISAEPEMELMNSRLVPRFHYLYAYHDDDVTQVAKLVRYAASRDALLASVDDKIKRSNGELAKRDGRKHELAEMKRRLREAAELVIREHKKRQGGLSPSPPRGFD